MRLRSRALLDKTSPPAGGVYHRRLAHTNHTRGLTPPPASVHSGGVVNTSTTERSSFQSSYPDVFIICETVQQHCMEAKSAADPKCMMGGSGAKKCVEMSDFDSTLVLTTNYQSESK